MKYYRHGDVTLEVISQIPKELKEIKTSKVVLALGEVTGHAHSVIPIGDAELSVFSVDDNKPGAVLDEIFFQVKKGKCLLIHEEHEPIILEEGIYHRQMKRQYNPFTKAVENVKD